MNYEKLQFNLCTYSIDADLGVRGGTGDHNNAVVQRAILI